MSSEYKFDYTLTNKQVEHVCKSLRRYLLDSAAARYHIGLNGVYTPFEEGGTPISHCVWMIRRLLDSLWNRDENSPCVGPARYQYQFICGMALAIGSIDMEELQRLEGKICRCGKSFETSVLGVWKNTSPDAVVNVCAQCNKVVE